MRLILRLVMFSERPFKRRRVKRIGKHDSAHAAGEFAPPRVVGVKIRAVLVKKGADHGGVGRRKPL